MKNTILFGILCLPLLIGCSSFGKNQNSTALVTPETIIVDSSLQQPCEPLPNIPTTGTFDDIATHYTNTIGMYGECSLKQDASIKAIKKFSNQKEQQ